MALSFLSAGAQAFALYYRVAPCRYPAPRQDAALAIAHVRHNAQRYHVDENKIAVMGFSAGGHLAASMGVMGDREDIIAPLGLDKADVRVNAMMLCYPVLLAGQYAHKGSKINLSGSEDEAAHAFFLTRAVCDAPHAAHFPLAHGDRQRRAG